MPPERPGWLSHLRPTRRCPPQARIMWPPSRHADPLISLHESLDSAEKEGLLIRVLPTSRTRVSRRSRSIMPRRSSVFTKSKSLSRPGRGPVGQPERRQRGRAVRVAGHVRQPAHRLDQRAERAALRGRAGLPEPGDPQDDQPRVDLVQQLGGEAPALEHARAGSSRSARRRCAPGPEQLPALRGGQLGGDGALVAAQHLPPHRPRPCCGRGCGRNRPPGVRP